jgi:hypothetical protein
MLAPVAAMIRGEGSCAGGDDDRRIMTDLAMPNAARSVRSADRYGENPLRRDAVDHRALVSRPRLPAVMPTRTPATAWRASIAIHGGRYGAKCDTWHDSNKWATIRFNHDRDTKFPLRAAHAKVRCDACHTGDLYRDKLQTACVSCHRKDDRHDGQLGARAASSVMARTPGAALRRSITISRGFR